MILFYLTAMYLLMVLFSFQQAEGQMIKPIPNKEILSDSGEYRNVFDTSGVKKPLHELKELTIQLDLNGRIMRFIENGSRYAYFYGEAEDGSYVCMVEDIRKNGKLAYTGVINDVESGDVIFILNDGDLNTIVTGRSSNDFDQGGEVEQDMMEDNGQKRSLFDNDLNSRNLLDDDGSVIDVMVLWSLNAECRQSDKKENCTVTAMTKANMRSYIQLAVEQTNTAFEKSGIETSLRLVRSYRESNYEESRDGSFTYGETLDYLRLEDDGEMDDVHQFRAEYRADIVVMLIEQTGLCGLAYKGPGRTLMFSVVEVGCAVGNLSFGHEIGHCMGLKHDQGSQGECDTTAYNFGYRDPEGEFRTIMAIDCEDSAEFNECDANPSDDCPKVLRYSTPDPQYNYGGELVGSKTANAAKHINEVAYEVANYYKSQGPPPTMAPTPPLICRSAADCFDNSDCTIKKCNRGNCIYENSCVDCGRTEITIELTTDDFPAETLWYVIDSDGMVVLESDPYMNEGSYSHSLCLDDGNYEFQIKDIEEDGICCESGQGGYLLFVDNRLVASGGEFESIEKVKFKIGKATPGNSSLALMDLRNGNCLKRIFSYLIVIVIITV